MGLLWNLLFGQSNRKNTKDGKRNKLEQEMNAHGLFEDEKKLVRAGQYDPWDFEEEEMDEDSYYADDT